MGDCTLLVKIHLAAPPLLPGVFHLSNPYWSATAWALILQASGLIRRAGGVNFTAPGWVPQAARSEVHLRPGCSKA